MQATRVLQLVAVRGPLRDSDVFDCGARIAACGEDDVRSHGLVHRSVVADDGEGRSKAGRDSERRVSRCPLLSSHSRKAVPTRLSSAYFLRYSKSQDSTCADSRINNIHNFAIQIVVFMEVKIVSMHLAQRVLSMEWRMKIDENYSIVKVIQGILLLAAVGEVQAQSMQERSSFVVVGDPQIHSMSGGQILQSSIFSDYFVKVARRTPEENLLAEYSLQGLLSDATAINQADPHAMVVLLGDGMNMGCTGEYDTLDARLNEVRGDGQRIVLWAHGNHDTYLSGTINRIFPSVKGGAGKSHALDEMMASEVPVDTSWWNSSSPRFFGYPAWNNVCWDLSGSLPINKGQWIARYAKSIGIKLVGNKERQSVYQLSAQALPSSLLYSKNYSIMGKWFQPLSSRYATEDAVNTPYLSYIVQGIDVGAMHRLILIDTSVCRVARLTRNKNAGTNGCIGGSQFQDIEAMVDATDKSVVIGAHFPIGDLSESEQKELLRILNKNNRSWSYLSAHRHESYEAPSAESRQMQYANAVGESRYDYTVGSTTDWPMEAHRVFLNDENPGLALVKVSSLAKPSFSYSGYSREANAIYELCRHFSVAERLAAIDLSMPAEPEWKGGVLRSEIGEVRKCQRAPKEYAVRLKAARMEIDRRMSNVEYRERMMMIMRAASWASKNQRTLPDPRTLFVR